MPSFAVEIPFIARDRTSSVLTNMTANSKKFTNQTTAGLNKVRVAALGTGNIFRSIIGANLVSRAMMEARQAISMTVGEVIEFDHALTKASARFVEIPGRGTPEWDKLEKKTREIARVTKFTATETSLAVDEFAKAGRTVEETLTGLSATADIATNADIQIAEAVKISTGAMGAFGLEAKELDHVADVLSLTANKSKTTIENLSEIITYAGSSFRSVGVDIDHFSAMSRVLAQSNIEASIAGTSLKAIIERLINPVGQAKEAMQKLHLSFGDPKTGKIRDLFDVLEELETKLKKYTPFKQKQLLSQIFQERGIRGIIPLLSVGVEKLRQMKKEAQESSGYASEMAQKIYESTRNRIALLKSAVVDLGIGIFGAFKGDADTKLTDITEYIRNIDTKQIVEGIREAFKFIKETYSVAQKLIPVFKTYVALWAVFKVQAMAFKALKIISDIRDFTVGMIALNSAMRATRIVEVTGQLGGFSSGIKNVNIGVKDQVKLFGGWIKTLGAVGTAAALGVGVGNAIYENIIKPIIKDYFKLEGVRKELELIRSFSVEDLNEQQVDETIENTKKVIKEETGSRAHTRAPSVGFGGGMFYPELPIDTDTMIQNKAHLKFLEKRKKDLKTQRIMNEEYESYDNTKEYGQTKQLQDWEVERFVSRPIDIKIENNHTFKKDGTVETESKVVKVTPVATDAELGSPYFDYNAE